MRRNPRADLLQNTKQGYQYPYEWTKSILKTEKKIKQGCRQFDMVSFAMQFKLLFITDKIILLSNKFLIHCLHEKITLRLVLSDVTCKIKLQSLLSDIKST